MVMRDNLVRVCVFWKGRKIYLVARRLSRIGMARGLMFRRRNCESLLFDFGTEKKGILHYAIHSWFVFFSFVAVWLDEKDNVVDVKVVRPFRSLIVPPKACRSLVEIPLNPSTAKLVGQFVDGY